MIKLVVMDIDGVLTDGTVLFDEDGHEFKRIFYRDLDAIGSLRRGGYKVGFVTGEATRMAELFRQRLPHDYFEIGCQDKLAAVQAWLEHERIDVSELCYVGDGASDVQALAFAGLGVCPADSSPHARVTANLILDARGGQGSVEELAIKLLEGADDYFRSIRR